MSLEQATKLLAEKQVGSKPSSSALHAPGDGDGNGEPSLCDDSPILPPRPPSPGPLLDPDAAVQPERKRVLKSLPITLEPAKRVALAPTPKTRAAPQDTLDPTPKTRAQVRHESARPRPPPGNDNVD